jgi:hypothetical protein
VTESRPRIFWCLSSGSFFVKLTSSDINGRM